MSNKLCVGSRWVLSSAKKEDADEDIAKYDGKCSRDIWELWTPGKHCFTDDDVSSGLWAVEEMKDSKLPGDKGLVLKSRAKHHAISALLLRPFTFDTQPLIIQ